MAAGPRHGADRAAADLVRRPTGLLSLALGVAAGAAYVTISTFRQGAIPPGILFDGFAPPQPYRWVSPPPRFASANQPPLPGGGTVQLSAEGSDSASISTPDGQAFFIAPKGAFPAREAQRSISISITPRDPASVGSAPGGLALDGNAYTFAATYQPSGEPASPGKRVSVVLRYPIHATVLLRLGGNAWTRIETIRVPASLEVFANTTSLGTFVPAAPRTTSPPWWVLYVSITLIVIAAVAGLVGRLRMRRVGSR